MRKLADSLHKEEEYNDHDYTDNIQNPEMIPESPEDELVGDNPSDSLNQNFEVIDLIQIHVY